MLVVSKITMVKEGMKSGLGGCILNYTNSLEQIENTTVKLVTFPDGHMSHIENQEELKTVLLDFLRDLRVYRKDAKARMFKLK